jgi:hypothetical protein
MKHTDYLVVSYSSCVGLSDIVKKMLKEGWQCQGGVSVAPNHDYVQTMVLQGETND